MSGYIDEAQVEIVTVDYFRELGYEYIHGPVIAPDGDASGQVRWGHDLVHTFLEAKAIGEEVQV